MVGILLREFDIFKTIFGSAFITNARGNIKIGNRKLYHVVLGCREWNDRILNETFNGYTFILLYIYLSIETFVLLIGKVYVLPINYFEQSYDLFWRFISSSQHFSNQQWVFCSLNVYSSKVLVVLQITTAMSVGL